MSFRIHLTWLLIANVGWSCAESFAQRQDYEITIDLTEADRHQVSAIATVQVQPGKKAVFWYPKWVNGTHAPHGRVENLCGLTFQTDGGQELRWRRESRDPCRFTIDVPEGVTRVSIRTRYIINQPSPTLHGADAEFRGNHGYFNWNTCLLYPDIEDTDQLIVSPRIKLPQGWYSRSPLTIDKQLENEISFQSVSLMTLVDSPLILGVHLKTTSLTSGDNLLPAHYLHVVGDDRGAEQLPHEVLDSYKRLVKEAHEMFGRAPYEDYHFLVLVSDAIESSGLEHSSSSLNILARREIFNEAFRVGFTAELVPHEFVHAWCGKFRRPAGMAQKNFHDDKQLNLLWVYEGLTEYLGCVLAVRSGLETEQQFSEILADRINQVKCQNGRQWRSLEDTAVTSYLLSDWSDHWQLKRRGQDYYEEGALIWLEADSIIRNRTKSQKSLDDFCRDFFGIKSDQKMVPFTEQELYDALNSTCQYDWSTFFRQRVKTPQKNLNLCFLETLGYRFEYGSEPTTYHQRQEQLTGLLDESVSFGLKLNPETGQVDELVPESAADFEKVAEGDRLALIEGKRFDKSTFRAILGKFEKESDVNMKFYRRGKPYEVTLKFDPQRRYPRLNKTNSPDLLHGILRPKAINEKERDQVELTCPECLRYPVD